MARYRPRRHKAKNRLTAIVRVVAATARTVEATDNFRALDRPPLRGRYTPLQWPPIAWNGVRA